MTTDEPVRVKNIDEETFQMEEVLNLILKAFDIPGARRANIFGNKYTKAAALERIKHTGYAETRRVLEAYLAGVISRDEYRPAPRTATKLLTVDWQKMVAFADRRSRRTGRVVIGDQKIKDEIIQSINEGGFDPKKKK